MTELPLQGILLKVLSLLDLTQIPYMIMGGFAVRAIGVPRRPTYDVDLTIEASGSALISLFDSFIREGFIVPEEFGKGFRDSLQGMSKVKVQKFEERHVWDVDLFLVTTSYQETPFARRQRVRFLGADRWMITAEDLILHKLLANKRKDLLEVEEILKVHASLDREYLREWAAQLVISDRLEVMLRESDGA